MEYLVEFLNAHTSLPTSSKEKIIELAQKRSFKKGEIIVNKGENQNFAYILANGITRSFFLDANNKEKIYNIFSPFKEVFSLKELLLDKPPIYNYDCLTDCVVYEVNFKLFKELVKEDIYISNFYSKMLECTFLYLNKKNKDSLHLNATEKYLKLIKILPEITNLVPQYQIASYLNITAVQLSRIRKNIYSAA